MFGSKQYLINTRWSEQLVGNELTVGFHQLSLASCGKWKDEAHNNLNSYYCYRSKMKIHYSGKSNLKYPLTFVIRHWQNTEADNIWRNILASCYYIWPHNRKAGQLQLHWFSKFEHCVRRGKKKKTPHTLSRDGLYVVGVETAVKHVFHVQLGRDLMIAKPDIICHKTIHWGYCQPEREHSNQDGIVSSKDNHSEELYIDWQWPFCLGFKWTLKSCTMLHSKIKQ